MISNKKEGNKIEYIKSPINWVGNKYKYLDTINQLVSGKEYDKAIDVFMGSGNLILNVDCKADKFIGNDKTRLIPKLYTEIPKYTYTLSELENLINKFNRFSVKEDYYTFRAYWNDKYVTDKFDKDFMYETSLLMKMCSNSMIRFNHEGVFNQGFRGLGSSTEFFADSMKKLCVNGLNNLAVRIKSKPFEFTVKDFMNKYLMVTKNKVDTYDNIAVSISGGSDSDIMVDMFTKCDPEKKVKYVFFDTGLEYQATKNHLDYLEQKYSIKINRQKAIKSIPLSCKKYGQPFLSKFVSEMISRLQKHNFKWEDKDLDTLINEYCTKLSKEDSFKNGKLKKGVVEYKGNYYKGCFSALAWWCNQKGENSSFNIKRNKLLKEFLIAHPPQFPISNKCCKYAKKDVGKQFIEDNNIDLNVVGVRKSEGGIRATRYKNCFDKNNNETYDNYRPIFFFTDQDKLEYKQYFDIVYSDCYEIYGMKRTGCVGCPYGQELQQELSLVQQYEPKLYQAVCNVFKDTYEYTKQYYAFRENYKCDNT